MDIPVDLSSFVRPAALEVSEIPGAATVSIEIRGRWSGDDREGDGPRYPGVGMRLAGPFCIYDPGKWWHGAECDADDFEE